MQDPGGAAHKHPDPARPTNAGADLEVVHECLVLRTTTRLRRSCWIYLGADEHNRSAEACSEFQASFGIASAWGSESRGVRGQTRTS